jgi:hypothetical protein
MVIEILGHKYILAVFLLHLISEFFGFPVSKKVCQLPQVW